MEVRNIDIRLYSLFNTANRSAGKGKEVVPAQLSSGENKKSETVKKEDAQKYKPADVLSHKAYFVVDEDRNIVIRVVDSEGKVVRQLPPDEYLQMMKSLKETFKNLIDVEV